MGFQMPSGKLSSTEKEHMSILKLHFERVCNNRKSIDWSVLHEEKKDGTEMI